MSQELTLAELQESTVTTVEVEGTNITEAYSVAVAEHNFPEGPFFNISEKTKKNRPRFDKIVSEMLSKEVFGATLVIPITNKNTLVTATKDFAYKGAKTWEQGYILIDAETGEQLDKKLYPKKKDALKAATKISGTTRKTVEGKLIKRLTSNKYKVFILADKKAKNPVNLLERGRVEVPVKNAETGELTLPKTAPELLEAYRKANKVELQKLVKTDYSKLEKEEAAELKAQNEAEIARIQAIEPIWVLEERKTSKNPVAFETSYKPAAKERKGTYVFATKAKLNK